VPLVLAAGTVSRAACGSPAFPGDGFTTEGLVVGPSGRDPSLPTASGMFGEVGWSLMTLPIEA
jgi:hypothetical protein